MDCEYCQKPNNECKCFHCKKCGHPDIMISHPDETKCRCVIQNGHPGQHFEVGCSGCAWQEEQELPKLKAFGFDPVRDFLNKPTNKPKVQQAINKLEYYSDLLDRIESERITKTIMNSPLGDKDSPVTTSDVSVITGDIKSLPQTLRTIKQFLLDKTT